jgi:hypothetical protein
MKCGSEISEDQVFCQHCLTVMEEYPIRRNIHVHLPKRDDVESAPKRPTKKKRPLSSEEQLSQLRLKVLRLRLLAAILAFLFCVSSAFLGLKLYEEYIVPKTGLNYTIDTSMNH